MIKFIKLCSGEPYRLFVDYYESAFLNSQSNIESACISTFSKEHDEVDARFVNIKFLEKESFIFFSNYNSPKSQQIATHSQISAVFFWNSINVQIRIKANISRLNSKKSDKYFIDRSKEKNALAISSDQSKKIKSYELIKQKYHKVLLNKNLKICPSYWGGFSFIPYSFEFWEGNDFRINKRKLFEKTQSDWKTSILEP